MQHICLSSQHWKAKPYITAAVCTCRWLQPKCNIYVTAKFLISCLTPDQSCNLPFLRIRHSLSSVNCVWVQLTDLLTCAKHHTPYAKTDLLTCAKHHTPYAKTGLLTCAKHHTPCTKTDLLTCAKHHTSYARIRCFCRL